MRLTEMISFLQKNPSVDDIHKYTHIDVEDLKEQMLTDKEFGKSVRKHRKEWKSEKKNI
jgi:predicted DNA binding CopG/RHH family protein